MNTEQNFTGRLESPKNSLRKSRFGCKIREKRMEQGLTQLQLGVLCGYENTKNTRMIVSQWENGKRPVPIYKLRKLANALKITLDELIP